MRYEAVLDPSADDVAALAAAFPESPFHTAPYAAARAEMGDRVVLFAMRDEGGRIACGCTGFARRGRLGGRLEIPSAPDASSEFWDGVVAHCLRHRLWRLDVGSFGSSLGTRIPPLPREAERRARLEHVIPLGNFAPESVSSNHRRSVRKARAAGVAFDVRHEPPIVQEHLALMNSSLDRRAGRGEFVARTGSTAQMSAFLRTGAGVCARAVRGGETLSSILVLLSAKGAYYHTAGNSPAGMAIGASAFLIAEVATWLEAGGRTSFNLGGGTAAEEGLHRFKRAFGGTEIPLEAAAADLSPRWVRLLRRLLKRRPRSPL